MMSSYYDLDSEFDIDMHAKTYINYLEVIIRADGTIEYAVPSHQEKLLEIIAEQRNLSRDEVFAQLRKSEETCSYMYNSSVEYLCAVSGCISVWTDFYISANNSLTEMQKNQLKELKEKGLYIGDLDFVEEDE